MRRSQLEGAASEGNQPFEISLRAEYAEHARRAPYWTALCEQGCVFVFARMNLRVVYSTVQYVSVCVCVCLCAWRFYNLQYSKMKL